MQGRTARGGSILLLQLHTISVNLVGKTDDARMIDILVRGNVSSKTITCSKRSEISFHRIFVYNAIFRLGRFYFSLQIQNSKINSQSQTYAGCIKKASH